MQSRFAGLRSRALFEGVLDAGAGTRGRGSGRAARRARQAFADYYTELGARTVRGWIRLARGRRGRAPRTTRLATSLLGREVRYPQALRVRGAQGTDARRVDRVRRSRRTRTHALPSTSTRGRRAPRVDRDGMLDRPISRLRSPRSAAARAAPPVASGVAAPTPWLEAATAFVSGDRRDGQPSRYAAIGSLPDEAFARASLGIEHRQRGNGVRPPRRCGRLRRRIGPASASCAWSASSIFVVPSPPSSRLTPLRVRRSRRDP